MYCKNCGSPTADTATYCTACGARLNDGFKPVVPADSPSFGFAFLSFFFPLVDLILFLVYEGKRPLRAKSCGQGALIGFITKILLSIVIWTFYWIYFYRILALQ